MRNILPKESGLVVNGVAYRYTVQKQLEDGLQVTVRNENANGDGYIFSVTDDWSGLPANTISKLVPTNIPGDSIGNGEIVINGQGSISDPTVAYSYTWDLCYNPLLNSDCPEYFNALWQWLLDNGLINKEPDVDDPYYDEWVQLMMNRETDIDEEKNEDDEDVKEEDEDEEKSELEIAFFAGDAANKIANDAAEQAKMNALTFVQNFDSYQEVTIPGGVYEDVVKLPDGVLLDNQSALRNFAQDELHKNMVRSQYD